jgi:4-hydroxy-2-oxoheptanedioate aldolase
VPDDHQKKLLIAMIESTEALRNLDEILEVEGIDVFFVGPGDLSQSMGYSPGVKPGERRPAAVVEAVDATLARIRAAGKTAGTLVVKHDAAHLVAAGAQLLYYHADPFVVDGVQQMREISAKGLR